MLKTLQNLTILTCLAFSFVSQGSDESIIRESAQRYKVPEELLLAICWVESGHNRFAYTYQDGGPRNHSFGLCQVLYSTATWLGLRDVRCRGTFLPGHRALGEKTYEYCKLFGPKTNSGFAAIYLSRKLRQYDGNWSFAIAAYNAGSVRKCPYRGWRPVKSYNVRSRTFKLVRVRCTPGGILNQDYVDKVLAALHQRRKTK